MCYKRPPSPCNLGTIASQWLGLDQVRVNKGITCTPLKMTVQVQTALWFNHRSALWFNHRSALQRLLFSQTTMLPLTNFSHAPRESHAQTPPSHEEKGLLTIEYFLGCAESAVSIPNKPMKQHCVIYAFKQANQGIKVISELLKVNNQNEWLQFDL